MMQSCGKTQEGSEEWQRDLFPPETPYMYLPRSSLPREEGRRLTMDGGLDACTASRTYSATAINPARRRPVPWRLRVPLLLSARCIRLLHSYPYDNHYQSTLSPYLRTISSHRPSNEKTESCCSAQRTARKPSKDVVGPLPSLISPETTPTVSATCDRRHLYQSASFTIVKVAREARYQPYRYRVSGLRMQAGTKHQGNQESAYRTRNIAMYPWTFAVVQQLGMCPALGRNQCSLRYVPIGTCAFSHTSRKCLLNRLYGIVPWFPWLGSEHALPTCTYLSTVCSGVRMFKTVSKGQ